jgi:predicted RNA-binding protein
MCLAVAYGGMKGDQPILQDIAYIRINGDIVELETLLGEVKALQGKVQEIDFMNSKVFLEPGPHT